VMTVSVCLPCLSASISPELHVRSSPNFNARYLCPWFGPSLAGVAVRYVLPVLLMTSCLQFAHNGPTWMRV